MDKHMKHIQSILAALLSAMALVSCNDWLTLGPIDYYGSESYWKTEANFDIDHPNTSARVSKISSSIYSNMYHMSVENKVDYGIAGGLGLEFSHRRLGHFLVEGRYYFGLGNIYGNSKRDFFGKSNYANILIKAAYLFDISKSKNPKIK
jgi:hypothetical protein